MADIHEADIAEWTKGSVQKGSGNQWHAQGDTKNNELKVAYPITSDGKSTMGKSIAISREMWKKLSEQTFNQNPALFLRFYQPGEVVRVVDLDLTVIRTGFFVELLEAARKWAAIEEEIGYDGELEAEYIVSLLQMAKGAFPALTPEADPAWRERVQLGQEIATRSDGTQTCPECRELVAPGEDQMAMHYVHAKHTPAGSGCDCCR